MIIFLKGRKPWRYVTGDIPQPIRKADETDEALAARLDDWDSNNHKIITWISNTSSINIAMEFDKYETAKEVWDHLCARYIAPDPARKYNLNRTCFLFIKLQVNQLQISIPACLHYDSNRIRWVQNSKTRKT